MSRIDKLQISGIRSFGPEEPKKIQFFTPLTLILGQNGCGKTTIIESLKYITTGDVPPGCGKGASFIHDPKMARDHVVRGQIKLAFFDPKGQKIVSTRSAEVTQKQKALQMKTLDATISRVDSRTGEKVQISSKCADFELEMTQVMGVSKAILNNVIFCHQEDSNWPLDEGKRVKEKFDAIFSATKYIKCLESISKLRKEKKAEMRHKEELISSLRTWKEEAQRKREEHSNKDKQHKTLDNQIQQLREEVKPTKEHYFEIVEKLENFLGDDVKLSNEINNLRNLNERITELRNEQTEEFDCSDRELKRMIEDQDDDIRKKEKELDNVKNDIEMVGKDINKAYAEEASEKRNQGALELKHKQHQECVNSRDTELIGISKDFSFADIGEEKEFEEREVKEIMNKLDEFFKSEKNNITKRKQEFGEIESKIQTEMDKLRSREAELNNDIKNKNNDATEKKAKNRELKNELRRIDSDLSHDNLDTLQEDVKKIKVQIQKEESKVDEKTVMKDIKDRKKQKQESDLKLDGLKKVIKKMHTESKSRTECDLHQKEKENLEKEIKKLKNKNKDELEHLLSEVPNEDIKNKLNACIANLENSITKQQKQVQTQTTKKTRFESNLKSTEKQVEDKEKEIRDLDKKIRDVTNGEDLDKALEKSKNDLEESNKEVGECSASEAVLTRYTEKLKRDDCCPLCHRDFPTKSDTEELIEELESKVKNIPRRLEQAKLKLKNQEKINVQLIKLQPQRERRINLQKDVEKLKEKEEEYSKELSKLDEDIDSNNEILNMSLGDVEMARKIQDDISKIDDKMKKVKQKMDKIEDLKISFGSTGSDLSMDEALVEQSNMEQSISELSKLIEQSQENLQEHKDQLQKLKDQQINKEKRELEIKTKQQKAEKTKEDIKKFEVEITKLEEDIEKAKEEVEPVKYQLEGKTNEKKKAVLEKETWLENENKKVNAIKSRQEQLVKYNHNISSYLKNGGEKRLNDCNNTIIEIKEKLSVLMNEKKESESKHESLDKGINNVRQHAMSMDKEKKIREKKKEVEVMDKSIKCLKDKISGHNVKSLEIEKNDLARIIQKKESDASTLDGRLAEMKDKIKELEREMRRKEIADAEKNYMKEFVNAKCIDMAADDLNKYYKALDTAIMRFHKDKMTTINRIIRELWRQTYKGNDIDHIEIKTDESESSGADSRRKYEYRVIMVKSGTEMDMRGRCSAGQKVLASLIIRMALAETFSANCGVLALDEPTTNLDQENIEALTLALLNIVKRHSHRRNFQLIVITHDKEFLNQMCRADYLDEYFEVTRDSHGLSMINKRSALNLDV